MPNTLAHFGIQTLTRKTDRTGASIEIDHKPYQAKELTIQSISGEQLRLKGKMPENSCKLSAQSMFTNNSTIIVSKYHVHSPMQDIYSKSSIIMLQANWLVALFSKRIKIK